MKKLSFRDYHIIEILKKMQNSALPLDFLINRYFRSHKALGSKDKKEISETIYGLVRWGGTIDFFLGNHASHQERLHFFKESSFPVLEQHLLDHVKVSFPKELFDHIVSSLGRDLAFDTCLTSNTKAPTTVRSNPLKTTREKLLERWKDHYAVTPTKKSPFGIEFRQKINFFETPEYKEGLFEVQDEGSQLLGLLMDVKPTDQVLDFCAGSGGKTLTFAYKMQGRGQIYLHDIRPKILQEAKKRLKRAGIQNGQILLPENSKKKNLHKKMDWVLVDAPCSGTGTLRRNPEMKWRFNDQEFQKLLHYQKEIFQEALLFLKPKGKIVWGTCSLLKEENEEQVKFFCQMYGLEQISEPFQTMPTLDGMDGFFGVVLSKI